MCGRASLAKTNPDEIADQLAAEVDPRARDGYKPRYNLAPTQNTVIVAPREGRRLVEPAIWGWTRVVGPPKPDGKPTEKLLINAMAETAGEKTTFRKALRERRAVLAVTGYYEWTGPPKDRRPIHFTSRDGRLLLLGALYADGKPPGKGESPEDELTSFLLLTTGANQVMSGIHHRMPVIIPPERLDQWLFEGAEGLLVPAPEKLLAATPASKRVNSGGEGPACWEVDSGSEIDPPLREADAEKLRAALALFGTARPPRA